MTRYLVFTMAAPIASFGAVAVGERRPTWDRPSKSQIIGLVAAALGIERTEEARQRALAASLYYAVRVDSPGQIASDFHTAQAAKDVSIRRRLKAGQPVRTRADELQCDDLKTILSRREYRAGSLSTIAVWETNPDAPTLDDIAGALQAPVFTPYAGRKAHVLMLPMAPAVIEAASVVEAFSHYDDAETPFAKASKTLLARSAIADRPIYIEAAAIAPAEHTSRIERLEERRDVPESRAKWRFGLRAEALLRRQPPPGGAT